MTTRRKAEPLVGIFIPELMARSSVHSEGWINASDESPSHAHHGSSTGRGQSSHQSLRNVDDDDFRVNSAHAVETKRHAGPARGKVADGLIIRGDFLKFLENEYKSKAALLIEKRKQCNLDADHDNKAALIGECVALVGEMERLKELMEDQKAAVVHNAIAKMEAMQTHTEKIRSMPSKALRSPPPPPASPASNLSSPSTAMSSPSSQQRVKHAKIDNVDNGWLSGSRSQLGSHPRSSLSWAEAPTNRTTQTNLEVARPLSGVDFFHAASCGSATFQEYDLRENSQDMGVLDVTRSVGRVGGGIRCSFC